MKQYIVKTIVGRGAKAIEEIHARLEGSGSMRNKRENIGEMNHASHLKGYIFIEAKEQYLLEEVLGLIHGANQTRIRGVLSIVGEESTENVSKQLQPRNTTDGLELGMVVILLSGPLKNSKATIYDIDEVNETISMELFDAQIPLQIPDFDASLVRRL